MDWLKEFLKPELIWFLVGLLLLLAEFAIPGLIVLFFGIGAWVVAVTCLTAAPSLNTQLGIFICSSVLSLVLLRSWLKGLFVGHVTGKQDLTQDLQEYIGERAVVTQAIAGNQPGKVELHGTYWTAEAEVEIAEGATVEIVAKENLTLKVRAL
ncbi:MAG: NfeD family protein [Phycisphaerales bacterium]|nr:MAG: NfeD family protein [Phycisphaerales bacterium]